MLTTEKNRKILNTLTVNINNYTIKIISNIVRKVLCYE